jgi:heterodisulfide reductase subunit A-like polyferredoxin
VIHSLHIEHEWLLSANMAVDVSFTPEKEKTMAGEKLLVIGGNAAGMTAAAKVRRLKKNMEIKVLEREGHVSYAS